MTSPVYIVYIIIILFSGLHASKENHVINRKHPCILRLNTRYVVRWNWYDNRRNENWSRLVKFELKPSTINNKDSRNLATHTLNSNENADLQMCRNDGICVSLFKNSFLYLAIDYENIRNINQFMMLYFYFHFFLFCIWLLFFCYHRQFSRELVYTCILQLGSRRRVSCHINQRSVSHQPMLCVIPCILYVTTCVLVKTQL